MNDLSLLQKLCDAYGISGNEACVRDIILKEITPFVNSVNVDNLGNVIAFKKGAKQNKTKLMLSAHMDEVGFIITYINDDGMLKFEAVGGINSDVICGKRVVVGKSKIPGVIGLKPVHLLSPEERQKNVSIKDLYVDIGATSRDDALKYISQGDTVYFNANYRVENNMIKSKAIDDRVGCFVLINLIKQDLPFDMYFVFSVQEEIGLRGAKVATFRVNPDAAIVVEATTAADIKGTSNERQVCKVGEGAVISFMDKSTIYDRDYYNFALELAKKNNIKVQIKSAVTGGNDSGAIHLSRSGVKTIAVSLPCRYLHSACGMICVDDLCAVENLVQKLSSKICSN